VSVNPHPQGANYDVRAVPVITQTSKAGDKFVTRGHCLHAGCGFHCEGPEADRLVRLHTEKDKHPTVCRTEILGLHHTP
jgi:hypothetical protein